MAYWYAIGPVAQTTDAVDGTFYHAPDKCIGWIDTRPITPGAVASGFFAFSEFPSHLKETHAILGDGHRLEEYYPDATERSAWETMYGVKTDASLTLVQTLRNLLFVDADPEGAARCLPGTPTHKGVLELHMGGHSSVWTERFTGRDHDAWPVLQRLQTANLARLIAEQTAEADRIRRAKPTDDLGKRIAEIVAKRGGGASYAEVREELAKAAEALPGKALTDLCRLYKCDPADVLPLGVEVERRKPETSIHDDFDRDDASALESGGNATWGSVDQGWAWAKQTTSGCGIVSGDARPTTGSTSTLYRANSALSSGNMGASGSLSITGSGRSGPAVRVASSGANGYFADRSSTSGRLRKIVSATETTLTSATVPTTNPMAIYCEADGSTVTATFDGTDEISITDTTFSGVYYSGFFHRRGSSGDSLLHTWAAEDLLAAAVVIPVPLLMLRA